MNIREYPSPPKLTFEQLPKEERQILLEFVRGYILGFDLHISTGLGLEKLEEEILKQVNLGEMRLMLDHEDRFWIMQYDPKQGKFVAIVKDGGH